MKEKLIELQKGDIVYFDNKIKSEILIDGQKPSEEELSHIIKVERPIEIKYQTIYEQPKEILTKKEKEYLENVLRPFKDRVKAICKSWYFTTTKQRDFTHIKVTLEKYIGDTIMEDFIVLPCFERDEMYKDMKLNKKYAIEELGLFKNNSFSHK